MWLRDWLLMFTFFICEWIRMFFILQAVFFLEQGPLRLLPIKN